MSDKNSERFHSIASEQAAAYGLDYKRTGWFSCSLSLVNVRNVRQFSGVEVCAALLEALLEDSEEDPAVHLVRHEVRTAAKALLAWCSAPEGAVRMCPGDPCPVCANSGALIDALSYSDFTFHCTTGHLSAWPELTYSPAGFCAMVRDTRRGSDDAR